MTPDDANSFTAGFCRDLRIEIAQVWQELGSLRNRQAELADRLARLGDFRAEIGQLQEDVSAGSRLAAAFRVEIEQLKVDQRAADRRLGTLTARAEDADGTDGRLRGGQSRTAPHMRRFRVYRQNPPDSYRASGWANAPGEPQFEGVVFSDGSVCVRWLTRVASHSLWASFADLDAVHGGQGHPEYQTRTEWED